VLDRFMIGRRPNPQRADMVNRHARVDGDSKTTDAGIDCEARATRRSQELDLGVESPPTEPPPGTTMNGNVSAALR
jgi:hypothetical protein